MQHHSSITIVEAYGWKHATPVSPGALPANSRRVCTICNSFRDLICQCRILSRGHAFTRVVSMFSRKKNAHQVVPRKAWQSHVAKVSGLVGQKRAYTWTVKSSSLRSLRGITEDIFCAAWGSHDSDTLDAHETGEWHCLHRRRVASLTRSRASSRKSDPAR